VGNALVYSTYLGGSATDWGAGIAVDSFNNAYITGLTTSTNFPTMGAYQTDQITNDVFITKLNIAGDALVYSTYLGGSDREMGNSISVDDFGCAYITGETESIDFPIKNALQTIYGGQDGDAFVAKLNSVGNDLVYSTFLGGDHVDEGRSVAVDGYGNAHVTGITYSTNFPIWSAYQTDQDQGDVFVTKLTAVLWHLPWGK